MLQIKGHAARISKHPVKKANSGSGECISENISQKISSNYLMSKFYHIFILMLEGENLPKLWQLLRISRCYLKYLHALL